MMPALADAKPPARPTPVFSTAPCVLPRLFSPCECATLRAVATDEALHAGRVEGGDPSARKTRVAVVPQGALRDWVESRLWDAAATANTAFGFDLDGIEPPQVLVYGIGDRFDWHHDCGSGPSARRKLSVSVQLSASGDYSGGDLTFLGRSQPLMSRNQGNAVVFPAFLSHSVTAVRRGTRYALVAWVLGPPFR
jgi:PKHD-type hydroxylase